MEKKTNSRSSPGGGGFLASSAVAKERGQSPALPCHILAAGDDAAAVEASILENVARLEPDEMQEFEAFKALSDKGRSVEEIANVFGVTELTVRRRLALGSLIPAIRRAYANEDIDGASVMALTLASEAKQKEWFQMFRSDDMRAPRGRELKRWLLGGGDIETKVALFSLEDYDGDIYEDLFGEKSVFRRCWKVLALAGRRRRKTARQPCRQRMGQGQYPAARRAFFLLGIRPEVQKTGRRSLY